MRASHLKAKGATEAQLADLATLMKHSRRVQDNWYDLTLKSHRAKRACIDLGKALQEAPSHVKHSKPQSSTTEKRVPLTPPKKVVPKEEVECEEDGVPLCQSPHRIYHSQRYPWTNRDVSVIENGMRSLLT